jgi:hypothetical protein
LPSWRWNPKTETEPEPWNLLLGCIRLKVLLYLLLDFFVPRSPARISQTQILQADFVGRRWRYRFLDFETSNFWVSEPFKNNDEMGSEPSSATVTP